MGEKCSLRRFVSTSTCGSWETTTLRRFSLQEVEEELLLLFMNHFLVKSENIVGFNEMKLREGNQHQTNAGETWRSAGRFQTLNNIWLLRSWWVWTFICQRLVDVHIFKKLISHPEAGYVDKDSHEHLEFLWRITDLLPRSRHYWSFLEIKNSSWQFLFSCEGKMFNCPHDRN